MYTIYRITNKINKKSYIGYTIETPPEKRLKRHIRSAKRGSQTHLHRAMRKDGIENFYFDPLCWGENHWGGLSIAEPLLIELFPHKYNMTKGGEGSPGRIVSQKTREAARQRQIGIPRPPHIQEFLRTVCKGVPKSPKHRQAISVAKMNVKNPRVGCPHCLVVGDGGNMRRWHFENCKKKGVL